MTSRLSLVESARALLCLQQRGDIPEPRLVETERTIDAIWVRCELWELTPVVRDLAQRVAPRRPLRSLDALHVGPYVLARRKIRDLELLSVDERLLEAAVGVRHLLPGRYLALQLFEPVLGTTLIGSSARTGERRE